MSDLFARFGREFRAGEVLFREGESGEEMFVIQAGRVQVTKRVGSEARIIATLERGDFLGETSVLNGRHRWATATVLEDGKCLCIDTKTLATMIVKNPEIAMRLIKKLAARLDSADALIQILLNPDPGARVVLAINRLAETSGEHTSGGVRVELSPDALARDTATSVADVRDVLSRLQRLRLAHETADGALLVPDVGRVLEFAEFLEAPRTLRRS